MRDRLIGTVQTDRGFASCSLGGEIVVVRNVPFPHQLELDVPAGAHALWMGPASAFPDQRELILARDTSYFISDIDGSAREGFTIHAEVLPRSI
ncbi:ADP-ribosyltransferase [Nocardia sp. NPDC050193]